MQRHCKQHKTILKKHYNNEKNTDITIQIKKQLWNDRKKGKKKLKTKPSTEKKTIHKEIMKQRYVYIEREIQKTNKKWLKKLGNSAFPRMPQAMSWFNPIHLIGSY